jgi:hypothetical protein
MFAGTADLLIGIGYFSSEARASQLRRPACLDAAAGAILECCQTARRKGKMPAGKNLCYRLSRLAIVPTIALALMMSGCLWGFVRDAETDAGVAGVTVAYTDAAGNTGSTTTDANGLYAFDIADGPVPATGNASFEISADGYHTKTESRLIEYNDNPSASIDSPSSFWEVQHFTLHEEGAQSIEARLVSVDISHALLATGGTTDCIVGISAYDPDDPGATLCHLETDFFPITSADPPPQALSLECSVPGDTLEVRVYVGVRRSGKIEEHDNSTAGFSWDAPSSETRWLSATLDSANAAGPDDPDLAFTASLEYRSVME